MTSTHAGELPRDLLENVGPSVDLTGSSDNSCVQNIEKHWLKKQDQKPTKQFEHKQNIFLYY